MRERLVEYSLDGHVVGITPARAGKTLGDGRVALGDGDHPRSCGKDPAINVI